VLAVQPTVPDPTRAPEGGHVFWAYVHVPHGSDVDMTAAIEDQIERFAPGFKDTIVERATKNAVQMEAWNPTYLGGDISNGQATLRQMLARPVPRWNTYKTPVQGGLPRLVGDAARAGRARCLRRQRRAGGAARGVRRAARPPAAPRPARRLTSAGVGLASPPSRSPSVDLWSPTG
jgi:hypothetical protein